MLIFGAALMAAFAVVLGAPPWLAGTSRAVAAYDAAAIVLIVLFWTVAMHARAEQTEQRAAAEDPGRNVVLGMVLLSVAVGLASAIIILGRGPHVPNLHDKLISYALAIGAVVSGWFLIHTMFTLRYAHLFYFDENDDHQADGGLTFPRYRQTERLRLRILRFRGRHDVSGFGRASHAPGDAANRPAARTHLLRLQHGDLGARR